jgi:hypothetical protein
MMGVMVAWSLITAAIGVWWLMLFNRAAVKTLFLGAEGTTTRGETWPIPIRILIVAWMMVASTLRCTRVLFAMSPMPPAFSSASRFTAGWRGSFSSRSSPCSSSPASDSCAGARRARAGDRCLCLRVINSAAIALRPGGFRRVMETYQSAAAEQFLPPQFFDSMASFAMVAGLASSRADRAADQRARRLPQSLYGAQPARLIPDP